MVNEPTITCGILALQGDYEKHRQILRLLNCHTRLVFNREDLQRCDGLILPGGESTTLINLLKKHDLWDAVRDFGRRKPIYGTCAGCILMAKSIVGMDQDSLNLIDITVQRNAYGRQADSFIDDITLQLNGKSETMEGIFIRAPRIISMGETVRVLASYSGQVILAEQDNILVGTFHPELTSDTRIHRYFVQRIIASVKKS
ncbi:MAG: pyridoxal 5'-phosphate synthase glutaminase subunit PdxT [Calditrichaeota bacterium]|nr:MAG: pyridoxal 5'-phosphate synthase glutaminase subunit PdxT [Calditrichota bacterium]